MGPILVQMCRKSKFDSHIRKTKNHEFSNMDFSTLAVFCSLVVPNCFSLSLHASPIASSSHRSTVLHAIILLKLNRIPVNCGLGKRGSIQS